MRAKPFSVRIGPDVMKWAIEAGRLKIPDVAGMLGVPESAARGWAQEGCEIGLAKLRDLSARAKIPLESFLLDEPTDRPSVRDYRPSLAETGKGTAEAVVLARRLQDAAGKMLRLNFMHDTPSLRTDLRVQNSPDGVGFYERRKLGLAGRHPAESGDRMGRSYDILRDIVESRNVFVFETAAKLGEMRGLSLPGRRPCVILLNSRDSPADKSFTLMHEYGHLLLGKGGLCAPFMRGPEPPATVESWCNKFAWSVLMPLSEFLRAHDEMISEERKKPDDGARFEDEDSLMEASSRRTADFMSDRFAVGKLPVAMYAVDRAMYLERDVYWALKLAGPPQRRSTPADKCVGERGRKFVSLVLESRWWSSINYRTAADYLGADLDHDELKEAVGRRT